MLVKRKLWFFLFAVTVRCSRRSFLATGDLAVQQESADFRCLICESVFHLFCVTAVRADRMRGGRNKFGPMYKRDRALKQQKKALIRSNGFKLESTAPPPASPLQTDYSFSGTLHSLPTISKSLLPSTQSSVTPTDYEANLYGTPSLGMAMQSHSLATQYQYTAFPSRAIKAECPDYTSSPESLTGYPYPDMYPSASPQPPSLPPLVLELLRCDPDELVVQNKIVAHLQQEQSGRGRVDKLSTFSLMCRMADQTLFSIVEWARSCIFFKELRVSGKLLHSTALHLKAHSETSQSFYICFVTTRCLPVIYLFIDNTIQAFCHIEMQLCDLLISNRLIIIIIVHIDPAAMYSNISLGEQNTLFAACCASLCPVSRSSFGDKMPLTPLWAVQLLRHSVCCNLFVSVRSDLIKSGGKNRSD